MVGGGVVLDPKDATKYRFMVAYRDDEMMQNDTGKFFWYDDVAAFEWWDVENYFLEIFSS